MTEGNAIEIRDIKKTFRVYNDKSSTIKEKVVSYGRRKYEKRSVLNGISFDVKKGEAVGLIGHNGCGKSTLLKLLTRIIYPDSGKIEIAGRISSLLELGAGFHPDMSGRENIYINASIFGLSKKEIDSKVDDIIQFSELEEFIDNPVRTYSSGMYMRLAFAVAINVNADVLLIDEILAVGDAAFQAKCFERLKKIKAMGATIIIVSHSTGQIEQICDRSIWIDEGKIRMDGIPSEITPQYLEYMERKSVERKKKKFHQEKVETKVTEPESDGPVQANDNASNNRYGNKNIVIDKICLLNNLGEETNVFKTGDELVIRIVYKVNKNMNGIVFGIGVWNSEGKNCYGTNTLIDHIGSLDIKKDGVIEFATDNLNLLSGTYSLQVAITDVNMLPVDYWNHAVSFEIKDFTGDIGICRISHKWRGHFNENK